jgi:hypothetical protein
MSLADDAWDRAEDAAGKRRESSEQQEYERKRDAHRAADQAAADGVRSAPSPAPKNAAPRDVEGYPGIGDHGQTGGGLDGVASDSQRTDKAAAPSEKYGPCGICGFSDWPKDCPGRNNDDGTTCAYIDQLQEVAAREALSAAYWKDRADAFEALHVVAQSAREATAWIVTDRHGDVLHFSKADGWKVAVVQEGEAQSVTAPLEVLDRCLSELANRYVGTVEDYYIHGLYRAREEIKRLRRTDNTSAREGKGG